MSKSKSEPAAAGSLPVIHRHAAGIDVGHQTHYVCVGDDPQTDVRHFGSFTDDLRRMADWLEQRGVTTIAMESTGVYWIPSFELLVGRGFEVLLVDPKQTSPRRNRPKTDVLDCQWIRRLHAHGLLTGSFRPDEQICTLRAYLRRRLTLSRDAARCIQQMQKAFDQMNVKLHLAITDITGKTGLAIIRSILAGERDPTALAKLREPNCKNDETTIARALDGHWRVEHLFELKQAFDAWEFSQNQMRQCDAKLHGFLKAMPKKESWKSVPSRKRVKKPKNNDMTFDVRELLGQIVGVDVTAIEGIDKTVALTLVAELGLDLSAFATDKHFGSWLGLAPNPRKSGKHLSKSRSKRTASRAANAFRLAAHSVTRSDSALGGFYRRLKSRIGAPKAMTATAYKIARIYYRLITKGIEYVFKGLADWEKQQRDKAKRALERKAMTIGCILVPIQPTPVAES